MAPRFKQLLFQVYVDNRDVNAFVGFPINKFEQISPFRDALRNEFEKVSGFKYRTDFGVYKEIDVHIKFFEVNYADRVNDFYSKPWPGCFSWLFRIQHYNQYKLEEAEVKPLILIGIETSHDFPCVVIESTFLSDDVIAHLIEKVACDRELGIIRSKFPYPMGDVLRSNMLFDAESNTANLFAS